ncbi:MAG: FHA domain-containing protein [Holophagales bacterium]|nr:FHA domain-containing protein [Holophagales bacterium]MYF94220.1 FHA domain-containing protein [Holophagales bacterium]
MPVYRTPDGRIVEETTLVRPRGKAAEPGADTASDHDATKNVGGVNTELDAPTVVRRPGAAPTAPARPSDDEPTKLAGAVPTMPTPTVPGPVAGWLVVVEGPGIGRDLRVGIGRNDLGRSSENRISLPFGDARISRRCHLWINYDPRHRVFSVVPGSGANLAYLNETAIEERMPLAHGATITVGETRLRFVAFCGDDFAWPEE